MPAFQLVKDIGSEQFKWLLFCLGVEITANCDNRFKLCLQAGCLIPHEEEQEEQEKQQDEQRYGIVTDPILYLLYTSYRCLCAGEANDNLTKQ